MKINEVDKVTELAPAECITAIAADGSLIQIPVLELGKVLEKLMPSVSRAFVYKKFLFRTGDTKVIGKCGGILVINFPWSDSLFSIYIVSSKAKKIELIHGNGYGFLDFTFNDIGELLVHSRYSIANVDTSLDFAYQHITG